MNRVVSVTFMMTLFLVWAAANSANKQKAEKRVVCYFQSWAVYNDGAGKFDVEDIDPFACTHIVYSFVGLGTDNKLRVLDPGHDLEDDGGDGAMKRFTGLRSQNPNLRTMLAIGGWGEGSVQYSEMVSTAANRKIFIDSLMPFLESQNFDGLDYDWEYPGARGGKPEDRENFSLLLKELRAEFEPRGYLLSAAISANEDTIKQAYNVPDLVSYLDFINVMTYDYHGEWEDFVHHHSPLYAHAQDLVKFNSNHTMTIMRNLGCPAEKLNLGIGTYGRGWTLIDENNHDVYAPGSQAFGWGYNQICNIVTAENWTVVRDAGIRSPYAYKGNKWIGYDDLQSVNLKTQYAREQGFGGLFTWAIDSDDHHGDCHDGVRFPLVKAMAM